MDSKEYRKKATTNDEILNNIFDFLESNDHLTNEELRDDLRTEGIDPDKLVSGCKALIGNKLKEAKLGWKRAAYEKMASFKNKVTSNSYGDVMLSPSELQDKIKTLLSKVYGEKAPSHALAYFRNAEKMTEDELFAIYKDLQTLEQIEDEDKNKSPKQNHEKI